jgi:hypothetical protein
MQHQLGLVISEHTDEDGTTIFRQACQMGLEGVVSKRLSAPYRSGPSRDEEPRQPGDDPGARGRVVMQGEAVRSD